MGIASGNSVGGTLSFGVHPKMHCPVLDRFARMTQIQVILQVHEDHRQSGTPSLFPRTNVVATEPHVDTTGSMSIMSLCGRYTVWAGDDQVHLL